jgi:hypothetical protein
VLDIPALGQFTNLILFERSAGLTQEQESMTIVESKKNREARIPRRSG